MIALLAEDRWRSARWIVLVVLVFAPVLIVPLTGMDWGAEDLIASTALILGAGVVYEAAVHLFRDPRRRLAAAGATVAAFLLAWAELSVGIFH